jgi:hypothetical protein
MTLYNSNNFTYFSGYSVPPLYLILSYLENNINFNEKFNDEILIETTNVNNYFNSINHYLIISPYVKDFLYKFQNNEIEFFIKNISMDGLWIDFNSNFKYKEIDIYKFIKLWKESLIKLALNIKFNPQILMESENYLINFN